jgi:hypothetical protein
MLLRLFVYYASLTLIALRPLRPSVVSKTTSSFSLIMCSNTLEFTNIS